MSKIDKASRLVDDMEDRKIIMSCDDMIISSFGFDIIRLPEEYTSAQNKIVFVWTCPHCDTPLQITPEEDVEIDECDRKFMYDKFMKTHKLLSDEDLIEWKLTHE